MFNRIDLWKALSAMRLPMLLSAACLCCEGTSDPGGVTLLPVNPNIKTLVAQMPQTGNIGGNCTFPVYGRDTMTIYCIIGRNEFTTIGSIFKIVDSSRYPAPYSALSKVADGHFTYLSISSDGDWLVAIGDAPLLHAGRLWLINTVTLSARVVSDSLGLQVFSAVFVPGAMKIILYATGGSLSGKATGYYSYSMIDGRDSLISAVPSQYYGFDVDPSGTRIVYGFTRGYRLLDLRSGVIDSSSRIYGEWFRFRPDGKQILYSDNAILFRAPTPHVGLIDVGTGETTVFDVNANGDPYNSNVTPYLGWSRDGSRIVYSQASLSYDGGYPGLLGLFVLKMY